MKLAVLAQVLAFAAADPAYEAEVAAWRAAHEKQIAAETGWLAVVGLYWLNEGVSRFGAAADNEIVFPEGSAPPVAGTLERRGREIVVRAAPGVALASGGVAVTTKELRPDTAGAPDIVSLGRLSFFVVERGGRFGLRLRDPQSPARKAFTGLTWFPVNPKLRIEARFVPHRKPRTIPVPNVLGEVVPMASPGRLVFRAGGRQLALDAVLEEPGSDRLWLIFGDATSERTTYPGGRFLYTDPPRAGRVTIDFNKAESPPCAYTAFATCPLPPKQNRLPVAIEAGETYSVH